MVNNFKKYISSSRGFTLIELLISMTILAVIGLYTAQALRDATQGSKRIQADIDISSEVKSAIRLMRSDLRRAFNSRDLYIALYNEAQRERIKRWNEAKTQNNQPAAPPPSADGTPPPEPTQPSVANPNQQQAPVYTPREELVLTQFLGEKDQINFTSLNGNSIRKNSKISDQVEIGYSLSKCKRRSKEQEDTDCLWRRLSYYLDGEIKEGGENSVLLQDVTTFSLKYLRINDAGEAEWSETWISDENGDELTKNKLPLAVEVNFEVSKVLDKDGKDKKTFKLVSYIPIDFTNNKNVANIIRLNAQTVSTGGAQPTTTTTNGFGSGNDPEDGGGNAF